MRTRLAILFLAALSLRLCQASEPGYEIVDLLTASSPTHSRSKDWQPGQGIPLEVGGMDWRAEGQLAVAIRKGEVWLLDGVLADHPTNMTYRLFASGLHEPLGLLRDGDDLLVAQRAEITRLRDTNQDGVADEYLTAVRGWNVSGAYHGYTYGPRRDGQGRLWIALNLDMGEHSDNTTGWRGWAGVAGPGGLFLPMAAGLRSPCGLGANRAGDMFCVDQQGTWIPTTPIYHLRRGAFFLNPEGLGPQEQPGSPLKLTTPIPNRAPYPKALARVPEMRPPAVWLPYHKMGRSGTDLVLCEAEGKFGPFDGQLLVAEFTDAKVGRVFLEKVEGEYQGAAFPFLSGFASGIVRLSMARDGSLFVGMTSRGWSSLGTKAYGLQRVRWNGTTPFAIKEMRARPDGFELVMTRPVDEAHAADPGDYSLRSYTYLYSSAYGSDEIDAQTHRILSVGLSEDRRSARLRVDRLREGYVYELRAEKLRSVNGSGLAHPDAYYTLNRIPQD